MPNTDHRVIGTSGDRRRFRDEIALYYRTLLTSWGPQNWWPAQSRWEMIVGAYLTQNTAWANVEKAMQNLRRARALNLESVRGLPTAKLAKLIRPSGYYRQKAKKLKIFVRFLDKKYSGSLDRMFAQRTNKLRAELLALNGVGPETADSILLYAGNHPVFVVDAYTHRIFERHGLAGEKPKYEETRAMVEAAIGGAEPELLSVAVHGAKPRHTPSRLSRAPRNELAQHYNEFHALIVKTGFDYCRTRPKCEECPLRDYLPQSRHE
ncbi:MAG TPA: endonuclease III domain-containing protein [Alphaproteobacteria bacterium]|nr:endonuclease III domain-containing protein [Alphaproteobacteria bacterium]